MSKPFDATLNALIDAHADDWVRFLCRRHGLPEGPAVPLDTDLSATRQADKLFRLAGPPSGVLHVEFESGGRLGIPGDLLCYNVLAHAGTGLPVHTTIFLLRPKATARDLTGRLELEGIGGAVYLTFDYEVVRVPREPLDGFLSAGVGLAPLAVLTDEAARDLPAAFARLRDRLRAERLPDNVERGLFGSTFVPCGLRDEPERIADLYTSLSMTLEDSTTYQWILNKGEAKGIRHSLLLQGRKRFGATPAGAEAALEIVNDTGRLDRKTERLLDAAGWDDLLATE